MDGLPPLSVARPPATARPWRVGPLEVARAAQPFLMGVKAHRGERIFYLRSQDETGPLASRAFA